MDDPMTPAEFRKQGYAVIDWIADYMETIEKRRVQPDIAPGSIIAALPDRAPEQPEPFEDIMRDLEEIIMPGVTHWQSPGWFAYFPGNASPPSMLGDLLSSALGQVGFLWATSPACTELEMVMVDWLVDLLGLPAGWKTSGPGGGVIQLSASDATHVALVVAREQASNRAPADRLVAYASAEAHSSVEKGARVAGFGHIRLVDVDGHFAMRPDALEAQIAADEEAGLVPAFVNTTVGTTGTTAVDPVPAVGEIARRHDAWHHVDAAYAGTAMICPEFRHHQRGVETADSYVFNPHKWMLTNFDCSVLWVADRAPLIEAMSIVPPYLRAGVADNAEVVDYRDWQVSLGRRFRSLKLWFVLRTYGAEGIRAMVRKHVRLATELAERVDAHPRLVRVAPVPFSLVTLRHVEGEEATQRIADAVNSSGEAWLTASTSAGVGYVRVAIGQRTTEARHVEHLWDLIAAAT